MDTSDSDEDIRRAALDYLAMQGYSPKRRSPEPVQDGSWDWCPKGCPHEKDSGGKSVLLTDSNIETDAAAVAYYKSLQEMRATQLYGNTRLATWQTRLLRIEPCNREGKQDEEDDDGDNGLLRCRLFVADVTYRDRLGLHDDGKMREVAFEALSYINGIDYPVTANLAAALRSLRREAGTKRRMVWIDALCIDQFNPDEKALQVNRMRVIYERARRVVVWEQWPEDRIALLRWALKDAEDWDVKNPSDSQVTHLHHGHSAACLATVVRILHAALHPTALGRIWVRQEMCAAREVLFKIGSVTLDTRFLEPYYERVASIVTIRLNDRLRRLKRSVRHDGEGKDEGEDVDEYQLRVAKVDTALWEVMRLREELKPSDIRYMRNPQEASDLLFGLSLIRDDPVPGASKLSRRTTSLVAALASSHVFGVTDKRDLVYGVLGCTYVRTRAAHGYLVEEDEQDEDEQRSEPILVIDYRLSFSQVLQSVVVYLFERFQTLGVLYFADCRPQGEKDNELPSWVPDWREVHRFLPSTRIMFQHKMLWTLPRKQPEAPEKASKVWSMKRLRKTLLRKEEDVPETNSGATETVTQVPWKRSRQNHFYAPGSDAWRQALLTILAEYAESGARAWTKTDLSFIFDGRDWTKLFPALIQTPRTLSCYYSASLDGRLEVQGAILAEVVACPLQREKDEAFHLIGIHQPDVHADTDDDGYILPEKTRKVVIDAVEHLRNECYVPVGLVPSELALHKAGYLYLDEYRTSHAYDESKSIKFVRLAMLPRDAQPGDLIVYLVGGGFPFVLRRKDNEENTYRLVGMAVFPLYFGIKSDVHFFRVDVEPLELTWDDLRCSPFFNWRKYGRDANKPWTKFILI